MPRLTEEDMLIVYQEPWPIKCREPWRARPVREARQHIHEWVALEANRQQVGAVPAPARATYTFVVPDRIRRDWDNYATICKPVQDGLVLCGVLPGGDHWEALEGNVRFRVEPGQRRLEITIEQRGEGRR